MNMKSINFIKTLLFIAVLSVTTACSNDAETVIIPKTLAEYKQEFHDFVTSQLEIVENCEWGYNKGDFRSKTNFDAYTTAYKTQLEAALLVLQQENLTIADIIKANSTLAVAGKNFQNNLYISDRRPLHEVIVVCEALNEEIVVGSSTGQVDNDAKVEFTAAIEKAKVIRNATTTVERQVAEAVDELNQAKAEFEAAIIK